MGSQVTQVALARIRECHPGFRVGIAPLGGSTMSRSRDLRDHSDFEWFPLAMFALTGSLVMVVYLLALI